MFWMKSESWFVSRKWRTIVLQPLIYTLDLYHFIIIEKETQTYVICISLARK